MSAENVRRISARFPAPSPNAVKSWMSQKSACWPMNTSSKPSVAGRATDGLELVFMGQQADFWDIQDLTAFGDGAGNRAEIRLTFSADIGTVTDHFIRLLFHRECVSRMSRLPSRTLSARSTRTAGQAPQPIRRGRLTARSTVGTQSPFQFLDPSQRDGQLLFQRKQFRDQ